MHVHVGYVCDMPVANFGPGIHLVIILLKLFASLYMCVNAKKECVFYRYVPMYAVVVYARDSLPSLVCYVHTCSTCALTESPSCFAVGT